MSLPTAISCTYGSTSKGEGAEGVFPGQPTMDRRTFVHTIAASVAGASTLSHAVAPRHLARIGLELYSVRDAMTSDPERTLTAVRAMGYDDVELLWSLRNFGRSTSQVKAALDNTGLRAPSAHITPETILTDWPASLDVARTLGHEYLIVPSLPDETQRSLDAWRLWADHFNAAGATARKAGIWLAFHNEPEHMSRIDGQVPYDLFVDRTDPGAVRLQLDFGNMAVGGGDPMRYLERYRERFWSFHLKDVVGDRSHDTELGAGVLDLASLLAAVPELTLKPCYVEQENPRDAIASARANYAYAKALDF
jgi:sugar phosphate isomerase/epimerase